jgi:hypothetical protein
LRELAEALPQLSEASLNELLAFEGSLVFAVLAKVAKLDGFSNLIRENDVQLMMELLEFFAMFFFIFFFNIGPRETDSHRQKSGAPGLGSRALRLN